MPARRYFNSDHLQSPYSRSGTPQSPNASKITRTPTRAPGSIFGKVRQMFSPTVWRSHSEQTTANNSILDDTDVSTISVSQNPPLLNSKHSIPQGLKTPSASNPFNEFKRLQTAAHNQPDVDSPNVKLAKFFASKGSEPLSEIELEGVQALLSKSQSRTTSPKTPKSGDISVGNDSHNDNDDGGEGNSSFENKLLSADTSKHALNTTPSFKATYNTSVNEESTDASNVSVSSNTSNTNSVFKKRVFDYSGFPSPYRTSRLKSYFSNNDIRTHASSSLKNEVKFDEQEPKIEPPKKLSNTAAALLSFIENSDSEQSTIQEGSEESKIKDFSNPYASHKKSKKPLKIKKQSAIEQLEQSLNDDEDSQISEDKDKDTTKQQQQQQQQQQSDVLNKYKPIKSSSLRESISLNDESDESMTKDNSTIEKDSTNGNSTSNTETQSIPKFTLTSSTPSTSTEKPSVPSFSFKKPETESVTQSQTKPAAFSFGSQGAKPTEPKSQPSLFSFSQKLSTTQFQTQDKPTSLVSNETSSKDTQMDVDSDRSLTIKETQDISVQDTQDVEMIQSKESEDHYKSLFVFPDSQRLGFTLKDIDEIKVGKFKEIFEF